MMGLWRLICADDARPRVRTCAYAFTIMSLILVSGVRAPNWPSTSYLVGSRLHRATPNMGVLDESRFFTNPMITALLNKNALEDAIKAFMTTEAGEIV